MPVIGLELSDPVHGHLALVALVLNVAHQVILAHALELGFDLLSCRKNDASQELYIIMKER